MSSTSSWHRHAACQPPKTCAPFAHTTPTRRPEPPIIIRKNKQALRSAAYFRRGPIIVPATVLRRYKCRTSAANALSLKTLAKNIMRWHAKDGTRPKPSGGGGLHSLAAKDFFPFVLMISFRCYLNLISVSRFSGTKHVGIGTGHHLACTKFRNQTGIGLYGTSFGVYQRGENMEYWTSSIAGRVHNIKVPGTTKLPTTPIFPKGPVRDVNLMQTRLRKRVSDRLDVAGSSTRCCKPHRDALLISIKSVGYRTETKRNTLFDNLITSYREQVSYDTVFDVSLLRQNPLNIFRYIKNSIFRSTYI